MTNGPQAKKYPNLFRFAIFLNVTFNFFFFGKKTEKLEKFKTNSCMQFLIIGKVALKPFANF